MGKLTALKVKAAKAAGTYQDGGGLMLVVKPSGAQSWQLRIQVNGKRRDFGLGSASEVSLADVRQKAEELRRLYRAGLDPVAIKRAAKAEAEGIPTFEAAARQVHNEHKVGWRNAKHAAQWLSTLEQYAFPYIGQKPVSEIDGPEIRDLLAEIWLSKPETARRVRQRIGTVLDWAHATGYRTAEAPMRSVSRGLPRQPKRDNHFAALSYEELPALMAELASTISLGRLALRFAILTACRSGEVRGATWAEIDLKLQVWTIPAARMKAGKEHVVPLSDPSLEVLSLAEPFRGRAKDSFVFPGNPVRRTRAEEGAYALYGRRLSISLMVQPYLAREYLANPISVMSGFMPRFLLCEPETTIGTRLQKNVRLEMKALDAFGARLTQILRTPLPMDPETRELSPRLLKLSSDAMQLLAAFGDEMELSQAPGARFSTVTGFASKAAEQAARIAGVLTAWEDLDANAVGAETMAQAIRLARYYLGEALRLIDAANISAEIERAEALRKWLVETWEEDDITFSEVLQRAPIRALREKPAADAAVKVLEAAGWVIALPPRSMVRGKQRKRAFRIVRAA